MCCRNISIPFRLVRTLKYHAYYIDPNLPRMDRLPSRLLYWNLKVDRELHRSMMGTWFLGTVTSPHIYSHVVKSGIFPLALILTHILTMSSYLYELPTTGAISYSEFCNDQTASFIVEVAETTEARANLRAALKEFKRAEDNERDYLKLVKVSGLL